MAAVLCGCKPTMLCGLLRKPGLGIKPQVEILGGDGVSVRKESTPVVSSGAATLPDVGMEDDEDREVTSASGAVCTFGVSTANSASMRKFLDFSIWMSDAHPLSPLLPPTMEKSVLFSHLSKVMMWSGV